MDLFEAALEFCTPSIGHSKAVSLKFELSAQHRHEQLQDVLSGFEHHRENHERHHHTIGFAITKLPNYRLRELARVHDRSEEPEENKDMS